MECWEMDDSQWLSMANPAAAMQTEDWQPVSNAAAAAPAGNQEHRWHPSWVPWKFQIQHHPENHPEHQ